MRSSLRLDQINKRTNNRAIVALGGGGGVNSLIVIPFIDFCKNVPANDTGLNTERTIVKTSDTTFTLSDTTRMAVDLPVVIKTGSDYYFRIVTAVSGNDITINEAIVEDFETIQDIIAANGDGMHLSKNGYYAMGRQIARTTRKNHLISENVISGHLTDTGGAFGGDPRILNNDNSVRVNFSYLPGCAPGVPTSNYCSKLDATSYIMQSNQLDYGITLSLPGLKAGAFVSITGYIQLNTDYYGEWRVELVDSNSQVVASKVINRQDYYSTIYLNTTVAGDYTLNFKSNKVPPASRYNIFKMTSIHVNNKTGSENIPVFSSTAKIALFGDSWTQRISGTPSKLRPDGSTLNGLGTLGEGIKSILPNTEIVYVGLAGSTSEWARSVIDYVIQQKPTHIVMNFVINDYNSRTLYPSTPSNYDYHPTNKWALLRSDLGGIFGSVDKSRYLVNMKFLIKKCIDNNIQPVLLTNPPVVSVLGYRVWSVIFNNGIYE